MENVWRMERLYIPSNCFPKGRRRGEREREGRREKERSVAPVSSSSIPRILFVSNVSSFRTEEESSSKWKIPPLKNYFLILIPLRIGVFNFEGICKRYISSIRNLEEECGKVSLPQAKEIIQGIICLIFPSFLRFCENVLEK